MASLANLGEIDPEVLLTLAREMGAPQTATMERIVARDRPPPMPTPAVAQEQASAAKPASNRLFRDDIIDILRKYGLAGAIAGGAAANDQQSP